MNTTTIAFQLVGESESGKNFRVYNGYCPWLKTPLLVTFTNLNMRNVPGSLSDVYPKTTTFVTTYLETINAQIPPFQLLCVLLTDSVSDCHKKQRKVETSHASVFHQ